MHATRPILQELHSRRTCGQLVQNIQKHGRHLDRRNRQLRGLRNTAYYVTNWGRQYRDNVVPHIQNRQTIQFKQDSFSRNIRKRGITLTCPSCPTVFKQPPPDTAARRRPTRWRNYDHTRPQSPGEAGGNPEDIKLKRRRRTRMNQKFLSSHLEHCTQPFLTSLAAILEWIRK